MVKWPSSRAYTVPMTPSHKTCTVDGCDQPAWARGWCSRHYRRWHKYGDPLITHGSGGRQPVPPRTCSIADCGNLAKTRGWCAKHYRSWQNHGDPTAATERVLRHGCLAEGCSRPHKANGYCEMHWRRIKETGTPGSNVSQKCRSITPDGYVVHGPGSTSVHGYRMRIVPGHPNAGKRGDIGEHRLVMVSHLGRPLRDDESVHHKNGNRLDNRIENLELKTRYHGKGQSVDDRVADAIEVLKRYAPERLA